MAIKILIADDEMTVRKRIIKHIDWNSLSISEIREAEDGISALSVCRDFTPDILLTDVRMPRMDGIVLAKELRKQNPRLKIVFISGYADKEYLLGAIELQATNYVEKPLNLQVLFLALKHSCDAIRDQNRHAKELQELNILKRQQLAEYLISHGFSAAEAEEKYRNAFGDGAGWTAMACMDIEFFQKESMDPGAIRQITESIYLLYPDNQLHICAVTHYTSLMIFIFSSGDKPLEYQLTGSICPNLTRILQLQVRYYAVGVSRIVKSMPEARAAYETAVIAAQQCFFYENGFVNFYHNAGGVQFDTEKVNPKELISNLKTASEEHFSFVIRNLLSDIRSYDNSLPSVISQYIIQFFIELKKAAAEEDIRLFSEYPSDTALIEALKKVPFLTDMGQMLLDAIHDFYRQNRAEHYDNTTVNQLIRMIRSGYSDPDLSVDSLSLQCNLSPSYISHLFKDTTGQTLHSYIFEYRMQKAERLVRDPSIKIVDIAKMVGYRNGNYFSFQFKSKYGYSPTAYRELML